jgi:hypothetical protein
LIKLLEEAVATVSSWTSHKRQFPLDRKRKRRHVVSRFQNWLEVGYIDCVSLVELEKN